MDPVHTHTSHFLKVHPNIILPSKPVSSTKSNLYLANSLAATAVSEPDLYWLLTFQVKVAKQSRYRPGVAQRVPGR
jgi:hypothetical protein